MKAMKPILPLLLAAILTLIFVSASAQIYPCDATAQGEAQLREAADGMSSILASIPDGAALTVLSQEGAWALVQWEGLTGYVYTDSLSGLEEPEAGPTPDMSVTIFTSRRTVMAPGETVTLTSLLTGFEGYSITYQWECDTGSGFTAVAGGSGDSYSFPASIESLSWDWRLVVYVN